MGQCKHWEPEQMDAAAHKAGGKLSVGAEQRTHLVIIRGWLMLRAGPARHTCTAGPGMAGLAPAQGSRWEQAAADTCHNKGARANLAGERREPLQTTALTPVLSPALPSATHQGRDSGSAPYSEHSQYGGKEEPQNCSCNTQMLWQHTRSQRLQERGCRDQLAGYEMQCY